MVDKYVSCLSSARAQWLKWLNGFSFGCYKMLILSFITSTRTGVLVQDLEKLKRAKYNPRDIIFA